LSNPNPLKTEDELRCSGRVGSSCSTCGTNRVTNLVLHYARMGKGSRSAHDKWGISDVICDTDIP